MAGQLITLGVAEFAAGGKMFGEMLAHQYGVSKVTVGPLLKSGPDDGGQPRLWLTKYSVRVRFFKRGGAEQDFYVFPTRGVGIEKLHRRLTKLLTRKEDSLAKPKTREGAAQRGPLTRRTLALDYLRTLIPDGKDYFESKGMKTLLVKPFGAPEAREMSFLLCNGSTPEIERVSGYGRGATWRIWRSKEAKEARLVQAPEPGEPPLTVGSARIDAFEGLRLPVGLELPMPENPPASAERPAIELGDLISLLKRVRIVITLDVKEG